MSRERIAWQDNHVYDGVKRPHGMRGKAKAGLGEEREKRRAAAKRVHALNALKELPVRDASTVISKYACNHLNRSQREILRDTPLVQQERFMGGRDALAELGRTWWGVAKTLEAKMANYLPANTMDELRELQAKVTLPNGKKRRAVLWQVPKPRRAAERAGIYSPLMVPYTYTSKYVTDKYSETICSRDGIEMSPDGLCASLDLQQQMEDLFSAASEDGMLREPVEGQPLRWQTLGDAVRFTRHKMATRFGGRSPNVEVKGGNSTRYFRNVAFYTGLDKYSYLCEYLCKVWSYLDAHAELFDVRLDEHDRRYDHASVRVRVKVPIAGQLRDVDVTDGGDAAYGAAAGGISSVAAPCGGCLYCEASKKKGEWFDDEKMSVAQR